MGKRVDIHIAGTLGDAFLAFCKIYAHHQQHPDISYLVRRFSDRKEFDGVISKLFEYIPYIDYQLPANDEKELEHYRDKGIYLTPYYQENKEFAVGTPYPKLGISPKELSGTTLGIQLHAGRKPGLFSNERRFTLSWIEELVTQLPEGVKVMLFGTWGDTHLESFCEQHGIINLVGKTSFHEWLSHIKALDIFLSPEGFSGFYALAQHVYTYIFCIEPGYEVRYYDERMKHTQIYLVKNSKQFNRKKMRLERRLKTESAIIPEIVKHFL